ncbi:MAG: hypothetical protein MMC33_005986 [Icmadophila ericetorum]|nr:hypothetical protein [Icmadophila ericetorum]
MSRQGAVSPLGALSGVSTLSIASGSSVDSPSSKAFKKQGHTQQRKKDRQVARKAMLAEVPEEEADGMGEKDLEEGLKGGVDGGENEDVSKDIVDVFPPEKGVKLGSCCTLEGGCEEVVVKGKGEVRDAKVDLTQLANARCHQE